MKRLSISFGLVLVCLLVGYVTLSFAASQFTPLSREVRIIPPAPDLPKDIAGFSGTWYGIWDNGNATTLVVEKIEPPIAIVIYSWGGQKGGWRRSEWKIESGKLDELVSLESGITITFTYFLSDDGKTLEGTYIRRDKQTRINYTTMQRDIPVSLPTISNPTPLPPELRIIPSSPDLPKEIAGFSGTWHGVWDNGRKTTLVVEKIEPPKVIAVYSYGEYKGKDGGWTRWEWTIKPGRLELKSTDELEITYLLVNGELKGTWKKGWTKLQGIMRKQ